MQLDYIFGIHAVTTALKKDAKRCRELLIQKGRNDDKIQKILRLAHEHKLKCSQVSKKQLDDLAADGVHQGVVLGCELVQAKNEQFLSAMLEKLEEPAFLLILDGVTDPHNLGACLRTADAAGVHAVIAPKDKSAPLNATVSKVACGAADAVPYVQVTNLARTLKDLQQRGVWITGTAGEAEVMVYEADLKGAMALVMGAEGKGLRRLTREHCDHLIKIPMAGEVSSLNVSVATGVCLFEAVRQRRQA